MPNPTPFSSAPAIPLVVTGDWNDFLKILAQWLAVAPRRGIYVVCDSDDPAIPFADLEQVCLIGVKADGAFQIGRALNTAIQVAWRVEKSTEVMLVWPETPPKGPLKLSIQSTSSITLAMAWFGLGCDHADRKENADALSCFKRAIETDPNHAEAWHNLGVQLHEVGQSDDAHKAWRRALKLSDKLGTLQAIAITIPGSPNADHTAVREARRQFVKARHPSKSSWPTQAPKRVANGRFRIGYISSFFNKSNWMKPVWGLINAHDRQRFQIHLFSDTPVDSLSDGYLRHEGDQLHEITDFDNEDLPNYIGLPEKVRLAIEAPGKIDSTQDGEE